MLLLILFAFFVEDTVYVRAFFPYTDELKFVYPAISCRFISNGNLQGILTRTGSILLKEYGNLSSISVRGTRTQDLDIQLNGVPLKTVQNDYADLSLLPTTIQINGVIIKHPLSSYGTVGGAGGGIFLFTGHKNSMGAAITSDGILEAHLSQDIYKVKTELSVSEKRFSYSANGFKKLFFSTTDERSSLLFIARDATVSGPIGTLLIGEKKEYLLGYSISMIHNNSIEAHLKGNISSLMYRSGSESDSHRSFYNALRIKAGIVRMHISSEYISSTKTQKRSRTTISFVVGKDFSWNNYFFTSNASCFYVDGQERSYGSYFMGVSRKVKSRSVIYANLSAGVHLPSFFDLYWPEDLFAKGNPHLKPEYIRQYEIGVKYICPENMMYLVFFGKNVGDMIQWLPEQGKYTPYNTGLQSIKGIEFGLTHDSGIVKAGFSGSYSFFDNILYYPRIEEGFYIKLGNFGLNMSYTGKRQKRPNSIKALPEIELIDLVYQKKVGIFSVELGINNLLDERIEWIAGYPQRGRVFYTKINAKWR